MAVKIRLRRTGGKKQASFRIVVTDSREARDGSFIENIGHYNPRTEPLEFVIDEERARYWLSKGAQPSDAVARLLDRAGIAKRELEFKPVKQAAEAVAAEE